jgi:hypothetical protein
MAQPLDALGLDALAEVVVDGIGHGRLHDSTEKQSNSDI